MSKLGSIVAIVLGGLNLATAQWAVWESGPFQLVTDAGERTARLRLAQLEQFRFAFQQLLGRDDVQTLWPLRVLMSRSLDKALVSARSALGRDAFLAAIPHEGSLPQELLRELTLLFLQSGPPCLPPALEEALAVVFSTSSTDGSRIVLGAPPPEHLRNPEWALMHLLVVTPGYYSGVRVLVRNLERGVAEEAAWRNAFGKSMQELRNEALEKLARSDFATVSPHSRTLRPEKDFKRRACDSYCAQMAQADLLTAQPGRSREAREAWQSLLAKFPKSSEAFEGLGILALADANAKEAYSLFKAATAAGSLSARAWFEYGRLETDPALSLAALEKASQLNPRWAAPYYELARREPSPQRRIFLLAEAARREPRNVSIWRELAEAQEGAGMFKEAHASWSAAELAATTVVEKQALRQLREQLETRRRQQEEEAARRKAEEEGREDERARQEALARIQAALDKARKENPALPSTGPVLPWWDGPRTDAQVYGLLTRVDCLGNEARLVIQTTDGKTVQLLIRDPARLSLIGSQELALTCGPQKPPRKIRAGYFSRPDPKFGTSGDIAVLEFPK